MEYISLNLQIFVSLAKAKSIFSAEDLVKLSMICQFHGIHNFAYKFSYVYSTWNVTLNLQIFVSLAKAKSIFSAEVLVKPSMICWTLMGSCASRGAQYVELSGAWETRFPP